MAVVPLQTSNVFSYTFAGQGNTHSHYLFAGNNNPVLNIGGQSWTIECWVNPIGIYSNYNSIFSKRRVSGNIKGTDVSYVGYLNTTSGVVGYYDGAATLASTRLTSNVWSHVAWVFNQGSNVRIFVNGTNVATNAAVTSVANIDSRFHIGLNPGENSQYFGQISNFRVVLGQALYSGEQFDVSSFPMQLPDNAIGPHAAGANVAASLTGNVVLLTCNDQIIKSNGNVLINGAFVNSGISFVGQVNPNIVETNELQNFSYYFPGNTSAQRQNATVLVTSTTNSLNLNADFTIETWYYPTSNTGVLLERGYAGVGNNSASYILIWDTPNNNINFAVANANNAAYSLGSLTGGAGSLGAPVMNAWNHIAVTRTGNTYRGFLNGALTFTPGTNANTPYAALGRGLTIGGMFNNGQTYAQGIPANTISGYISNLRIIRGRSVYNAAFTPSNTQLPNVTNTILLTALTPPTPGFVDLSGTHTLAPYGMNEITFSTLSPFTANAVANANATTAILDNPATGDTQGRIYNKFEYQRFGQVIEIPQTIGLDQGRIYDRIEAAEFALSVPIYDAVGLKQGRIYDKIESTQFAYIPSGSGDGTGGPTGNIEYEFWS